MDHKTFQYPKEIIKKISYQDIKGTTWVSNTDSINECYDKEFKLRMRVLDIALSIEAAIERVISLIFSENMIDTFLMEDLLFSKMDFSKKWEVLKSILIKDHFISQENLNFYTIDKNKIEIENFIIKINPFLDTIKEIIEIRNHIAHKSKIIFSAWNTIIKQSPIEVMKYKEIDFDEFMIKGHFILWILNLMDKNNYINIPVLEEYYREYSTIIKNVEIIKK